MSRAEEKGASHLEDRRAASRHPAFAADLLAGCTEIDQDRPPCRIKQNVIRRYVTMKQILTMHMANRVEQLQRHLAYLMRRQRRATTLDDVQQVFAIDQIERHIGGPVILKNLVHTDNTDVSTATGRGPRG